MFLRLFKWLSWLSAIGLILLVVLAPVLTGSLGTIELFVTFVVAGLVSLPGWIIYALQKWQRTQSPQ